LQLEARDPDANYKLVHSCVLTTDNENTGFMRLNNGDELLKKASFCTNGELFLLHHRKFFIFNANTGRLI